MESAGNSLIVDSTHRNEANSSGILSSISLAESSDDTRSLTSQIDHLNLNVERDPFKALSSLILDQLNTQDINAILEAQRHTIQRLDQTNRNMAKCNQISLETFQTFALKDFQSYINMLNSMRQDLEFIFKRVKVIKTKFQVKYPSEYAKAVDDNKHFLFDSDEEEQGSPLNMNLERSDTEIQAAQDLLKERSLSVESNNSVASAALNASAALVNLVQTARDKITTSSKGLVSVFINPPTDVECEDNDSNYQDFGTNSAYLHTEIQDEQLNTDELDKTVENETEETSNQEDEEITED